MKKLKRTPLITFNALLLTVTLGVSGLTALAVDDDRPALPVGLPSVQSILPEKVEPAATDRIHSVRLGREGLVPGRIAIRDLDGTAKVVNNVKVHFVKNGKPVAVVEPGVNGVFQAKGITPGEYAVIAAGPEVVSAYTVNVVAQDEMVHEPLDATLQLQSQGIPAQDFPVVNSMMNSMVTSDFCSRYCNAPLSGPMVPSPEPFIDHNIMPTSCGCAHSTSVAVPACGTGFGSVAPVATGVDAMFGQPVPVNELPINAAPLQPVPNMDEVSLDKKTAFKHVAFLDESEVQPAVEPFRTQSVQLSDNGKISGRIHWTKLTAPFQEPAANAKVAFIRNGEVHQIAQTDNAGFYEVSGLTEGSYSVFTACQSGQCASPMGIQSGCSAFSVDCVPQGAPVVDQYPTHIDSCLVGCPNMDYTLETMCGSMCGGGQIVEAAPFVEAPIVDGGLIGAPIDPGFGGYGGGFVGGGGGFGGGGGGGGLFGGGLGGLIGLTGAGLGIAALADDDNGAPAPASPVSP